MPKVQNIYRFFHGKKISSLRLLAYPIFGYVVSGSFEIKTQMINLLIIFFGVLFASAMNDHYDALLLGENNALGNISKRAGNEKKMQTQLYIWIPWFIAFGLFIFLLQFKVTTWSLVLLWASLLMSIGYSAPPARIKERKFLGIIFPPLGIFLLFLQAVLLTGRIDALSGMVVVMVFLLTWYAEGLHLLSDTFEANETHRLSRRHAVVLLTSVCILGAVFAAFFAFYEYIFICSIFFWAIRYYAIKRSQLEDIVRKRRSVFSNVWRIEEFAIYALVISI